MKTAEEIIHLIDYDFTKLSLDILKEWQIEIIDACLEKVRKAITLNPEQGEDDYAPGKYLAIGILHEFKESIK